MITGLQNMLSMMLKIIVGIIYRVAQNSIPQIGHYLQLLAALK